MAPRKPKIKKQPLVIRTHSLMAESERLLQRWSQEATDALGWTVSSSAMLRALLQYAARQPTAWASTTLFPIIEQEIQAGVLWGSKKK
jgi:hypothetical protein